MGSGGSFPVDLVLFGMIAVFLVLRLRSILGRRTGFERPPQPLGTALGAGPVIEAHAEPAAPPGPARALPDPASPLGQTLIAMQRIDPSFDPAQFLAGAEAAFRLIVAAFAHGDRVALRPLLSDDTYRAFEGAIAARETAGETQRTEIRAIEGAAIEAAELHGSVAVITVRIVSDQLNMTLGRNGEPVMGTDAVTEITDQWSFERDLSSRDPAWRLVGARSA
ncbi:MAG: Tim44/TimA family putative adaptor protein [Acetobacteraceae bacterium]